MTVLPQALEYLFKMIDHDIEERCRTESRRAPGGDTIRSARPSSNGEECCRGTWESSSENVDGFLGMYQ